jgi:hypothetical protein
MLEPRRLFSSLCAWLNSRLELTRGQLIQRAEPRAEVSSTQAALAVEPAYMLHGGALPLLRVAFQTAGHQVPIGIPSQLRPRHNVVKAPPVVGNAAQTIKALAALAFVEGLAQHPLFQEIRLLAVDNDAGGTLADAPRFSRRVPL